jgi:hypothetical protein
VQLAAEQQRCRQKGKRVLQAIGGGEARRGDMIIKRLAKLDERISQLEQRMANYQALAELHERDHQLRAAHGRAA